MKSHSEETGSNLPSITAIVLTYNEELHIERCINNLKRFCQKIYIIDSFSTDNTTTIAKYLSVEVLSNPWINYARQFNWALEFSEIETEWILRIDADEYLTDSLIDEIINKIGKLPKHITGIYLRRRVIFLGKWLRFGGCYPIKLLRIWRHKKAKIEQRWMDEHVMLNEGSSITFDEDFVDENLNGINAWINKHNSYSNRELLDIIISKHNLAEIESINESLISFQASRKKWLKQRFFNHSPIFLRAFLYFIYRYFILFGILDGLPGLIWHFMQGFWYRFLDTSKYK
jgi:glycosyltransferase involved in cell wall biosynthesis